MNNKYKQPKYSSYNIRIFESEGKLTLGFVHKCYKVKGGYQWKPVPNSVKNKIKNQLGIEEE